MTDNVEEKNINDQPVVLQNEDWYIHLTEGVLSTVVESNFVAKQTLIEGYHQVGKLVSENIQNFERLGISKKHMIKNICLDLGKPKFTRSLYYAIQFYKKFPDLESFLGSQDKTITWNKIKLEELPEPKLGEDIHEDTQEELKVESTEGENVIPPQPIIEWKYIKPTELKTEREKENYPLGQWQIFIKDEDWDIIDWSKMLSKKYANTSEFIVFLQGR